MRTIRDKPALGPIEQALVGQTLEEHKRIRTQAHLDAYAVLSDGSRNRFTMNGVTIQLLRAPVPLRNVNGRITGFQVQVRAQDANGPLPELDGIHGFINPPCSRSDGTVHMEIIGNHNVEVDNNVEDPVAVMQSIIYEIVTKVARGLGWKG